MIHNIQHFAYNTVILTIPRLFVAPNFTATSKKSLVEDMGVWLTNIHPNKRGTLLVACSNILQIFPLSIPFLFHQLSHRFLRLRRDTNGVEDSKQHANLLMNVTPSVPLYCWAAICTPCLKKWPVVLVCIPCTCIYLSHLSWYLIFIQYEGAFPM